MRRAVRPLRNTPSWCGAQLKHRDRWINVRSVIHQLVQSLSINLLRHEGKPFVSHMVTVNWCLQNDWHQRILWIHDFRIYRRDSFVILVLSYLFVLSFPLVLGLFWKTRNSFSYTGNNKTLSIPVSIIMIITLRRSFVTTTCGVLSMRMEETASIYEG
jgi:hypothetical protein